MTASYTTRTACRVCGHEPLTPLFSLGNQFVSDFPPPGRATDGPRIPIELDLCPQCTLVQARHTPPPELLYRKTYWYRSGVTQTMRDALRDVAYAAERAVNGIKPGDVVLDIGSNDGTLLRSYTAPSRLENPKYGIVKVGVEPAENLWKEGARGIDLLVRDFWSAESYALAFRKWYTKAAVRQGVERAVAKVITACGMFYDLDDPNPFIADVAKVLAPDGVFVAQLMCLKQTLEKRDVGNFCVKPDTLLLGDNVPIREAAIGQRAFGRGGELTDVRAVFRRDYSGSMVVIKPMYLEPIACTPEHPVLVARMTYPSSRAAYYKGGGISHKRGGPKKHHTLSTANVSSSHPARDRRAAHTFLWAEAKDVRRGDFVVVPKLREADLPEIDLKGFTRMSSKGWRSGLTSVRITEDLAWALGLYVAEGHTGGPDTNRAIWFTLSSKEMHLVCRLRKAFGEIGYKVTLVDRSKTNNSICAVVTCCSLARAFREWFGCRATEKRIPDFLMTAPSEIKKAFLRGLVAGDGYRRGNKVHYHTSSKLLALQVQLMAFSMGGMLGVGYVKPYERTVRSKPVKSKDSWQLRGSSKALAEIFGYEHSGKEVQQGYVGEDYILLPVKQVRSEEYAGPVCNIETGDHTYLVSNAVVHNCHEHLEFYSLKSLERLFGAHGLEIFHVEENSVNGGSYRLYVGHVPAWGECGKARNLLDQPNSVAYAFFEESRRKLSDSATYAAFFRELERDKAKVAGFLRGQVAAGKTVYIIGASTKGNCIAQYYGLDQELIRGASERSPEKCGRVMVGTGIPIVSEEEARAAKPDFFLVLPYAFLGELIERERAWLAGGGTFVVPLPMPRLVTVRPEDRDHGLYTETPL